MIYLHVNCYVIVPSVLVLFSSSGLELWRDLVVLRFEEHQCPWGGKHCSSIPLVIGVNPIEEN